MSIISERFQLQLTEVDTKARTLVACFSPLHLFDNWRLLFASLELHSHYGVDLFVIPIAGVIDSIYTLLRTYEREGKVRLKHAIRLPRFVRFSAE
jgi:hypothetical protein